MSAEPYIGDVMMFAGSFAPLGYLECNGQLVSIIENQTLFTLIGTTYGGDGVNTFAVPDLRGRIPVHQGTGPGLSTYAIGQTTGVESVTLLASQMPSHNHPVTATEGAPSSATPAGRRWVSRAETPFSSTAPTVPMAPQAVQPAGGSQPHDNMTPYLGIRFCIATQGLFPAQG
ncbi:phage tail protein [Schumannella sp. 10F1B-5-1]|uniref:phage tail protein n=1 Tax=Schumannella sp. 10F1B-5-1 TaxID=2590780 RepID=UPI0011327AD5|nr:tail fiber protein [Schumannella sp. 10F1B-5-1]TPW76865.1 phage tail protein [Schumannella sp. 10F1B-5-1]